MFSVLSIFVFVFIHSCVANKTYVSSCEDNYKLYVDLCSTPKQQKVLDFKSLLSDGENVVSVLHYGLIGNDVMQRHVYKALKEEEADPNENLDSTLCFKALTESIDKKESLKGSFAGFDGSIKTNWNCNASADFPGAERCDYRSATEKFSENTLVYFTMLKNNFAFEIDCFPNGEVGWVLFSTDPKITEEELKVYYEHAESLGFSRFTNRKLFDNNNCSL